MGRRAKEIIYPHLNDCKGDVNGVWYVEYSVLNKLTGEKPRPRIYEGFEKYTTYEEKKAYADKIIEEYTEKLKSGWRPWDNDKIEFEDLLTYYNATHFKGNKTQKTSYIQPLFTEYLKWIAPSYAESSLQDHISKLRQFSQYLDAKGILEKDIYYYDYGVIVEFLRTLAVERKYAERTIQKYKQVLYKFFSYLKKERKIITLNPLADDIPRLGQIVDMAPAGMGSDYRVMLKEEILKEDPELWMACCFIYYTTIRPSELRFLKIKQININSGSLTVFNDIAKGRRTETIDIPDELLKLITDEWRLQDYDRELYLFGIGGGPGFIPLGKNTMRYRFNKFRDRLNLPKEIKYYSWKHSGAQELADSGASTYELQRHLRHKHLSTTEEYLKKRVGQRSKKIKHNFTPIG